MAGTCSPVQLLYLDESIGFLVPSFLRPDGSGPSSLRSGLSSLRSGLSSPTYRFITIVQVISVAGAHEINANLVAEVFPNTIFKLRKWFGMDDAGNFQKMVCCNKCYRIYPDDGSMRYRSNDRHRKLLTRPCYGAVVKQGPRHTLQ